MDSCSHIPNLPTAHVITTHNVEEWKLNDKPAYLTSTTGTLCQCPWLVDDAPWTKSGEL